MVWTRQTDMLNEYAWRLGLQVHRRGQRALKPEYEKSIKLSVLLQSTAQKINLNFKLRLLTSQGLYHRPSDPKRRGKFHSWARRFSRPGPFESFRSEDCLALLWVDKAVGGTLIYPSSKRQWSNSAYHWPNRRPKLHHSLWLRPLDVLLTSGRSNKTSLIDEVDGT